MNNQQGFLLVEVLVTLAVLSLGIVLVLATLQRCAAAARLGEHHAAALRAAEARLWGLQAGGTDDPADTGRFRCRTEREALADTPLDRVRLAVAWDESGIEKELWLTTCDLRQH